MGEVWSIQGRSGVTQDYVIKHLTYGTVPKGWVQAVSPIPLQENVYYSVNEQFFFVLTGKEVVPVYSLAEFAGKKGSLRK